MKMKMGLQLAALLGCLALGTAAGTSVKAAMPECEKYGQAFEVDLATVGTGLAYTGYYYGELDVDGITRTYREYFPETAVFNSYQVMIAVPDGADTDAFLEASGWKDLADRENFSLFILEPADGQWGTAEEEAAYIASAYAKRTSVTNACCSYLVGYDQGGEALQKYIMTDSLGVASAVFVNASGISQEYLDSLAEGTYQNNEADTMVAFNEMPVPVWIVSTTTEQKDAAAAVVDYWKQVNGTVAEGESFDGGEIFRQDEAAAAVNHFTPDGAVASVIVLEDESLDVEAPETAEMFYQDFLCLTNRYGSTAWSNEVYPRLNLKDDENMTRYTILFEDTLREYCIYLPKGYEEGNEYPIVYTLPGGDQTDIQHMEISRWNEVADEEGYIVVAASGTTGLHHMEAFGASNALVTGEPITKYLAFNDTGSMEAEGYTDDFAFFQELINQVENTDLAALGVQADATRRYLSVHSNGAAFAKNFAVEYGEYFAAIGSYSGNLPKGDLEVPVYAVIGQNNGPVVDWDTNEVSEKFAPSLQNIFVSVWGYSEEDADAAIAAPAINGEVVDLGNGMSQKTWQWNNEDGIPMFKTTTTSYRGHSFVLPDTPVQAEWFSHWSRVDGVLYYDGEPAMAEEAEPAA